MPDADDDSAHVVAERIRIAVESQPFILLDGRQLSVTVSIGAAVANKHDNDPQTVISRADQALYRSKAAGRNMVSFHAAAAKVLSFRACQL